MMWIACNAWDLRIASAFDGHNEATNTSRHWPTMCWISLCCSVQICADTKFRVRSERCGWKILPVSSLRVLSKVHKHSNSLMLVQPTTLELSFCSLHLSWGALSWVEIAPWDALLFRETAILCDELLPTATDVEKSWQRVTAGVWMHEDIWTTILLAPLPSQIHSPWRCCIEIGWFDIMTHEARISTVFPACLKALGPAPGPSQGFEMQNNSVTDYEGSNKHFLLVPPGLFRMLHSVGLS